MVIEVDTGAAGPALVLTATEPGDWRRTCKRPRRAMI